jgi:replicative superfamily II helicase
MGYIITTHDMLAHYISRMASQVPIESQFTEHLLDNLNAEICSTGSVTNLEEAVQWIGYTYLYIRMLKNPSVYGLQTWNPALDPSLVQHRRELITIAARKLAKAQMIVFNEETGFFTPKDLGRTAAGFYLRKDTVDVMNESLHMRCTEADVLVYRLLLILFTLYQVHSFVLGRGQLQS